MHRSAEVFVLSRALLGVSLLFVVLPAARAQEPSLEPGAPPLAVQRYFSGRELYRQGNLAGAADEFRTAFDLFPTSAKLAFNLGRVSERLGRSRDAVDYYAKYLELAPTVQDRAEIEALVASLRRRLTEQQGDLVVTTEPLGADVFVDGAATPLGKTPLTARLEAGEHALRVALAGHTAALQTVRIESGKRAAVTLRLVAEGGAAPAPVAVAPVRQPPAEPSGRPWWPCVVAGAGAVMRGDGGRAAGRGLGQGGRARRPDRGRGQRLPRAGGRR